MKRKISIALFVVLVLFEFTLWTTNYSYTYPLTKLLVRSYLIVITTLFIVTVLHDIPRQFLIALSAVGIIIFISLAYNLMTPFAMGYSGHSTKKTHWKNNKYFIENVKGQEWAGPPYNNFILYKTSLMGYIKKQINLTSANSMIDSCNFDFLQFHSDDTVVYRFDNCDKKMIVITKN